MHRGRHKRLFASVVASKPRAPCRGVVLAKLSDVLHQKTDHLRHRRHSVGVVSKAEHFNQQLRVAVAPRIQVGFVRQSRFDAFHGQGPFATLNMHAAEQFAALHADKATLAQTWHAQCTHDLRAGCKRWQNVSFEKVDGLLSRRR